MKDAEKTTGNLIDKQGVAFVGSVDDDGFSNMKAMLPLRARKRSDATATRPIARRA